MKHGGAQAPPQHPFVMFRILTPRRIETFKKKAGLLAYASPLPSAFPSLLHRTVAPLRVALHLQWRDRAGLAPAFPFKQILWIESAPFSLDYQILIFIIISTISLYVYRKAVQCRPLPADPFSKASNTLFVAPNLSARSSSLIAEKMPAKF